LGRPVNTEGALLSANVIVDCRGTGGRFSLTLDIHPYSTAGTFWEQIKYTVYGRPTFVGDLMEARVGELKASANTLNLRSLASAEIG
jgi:hypothetical protein